MKMEGKGRERDYTKSDMKRGYGDVDMLHDLTFPFLIFQPTSGGDWKW